MTKNNNKEVTYSDMVELEKQVMADIRFSCIENLGEKLGTTPIQITLDPPLPKLWLYQPIEPELKNPLIQNDQE